MTPLRKHALAHRSPLHLALRARLRDDRCAASLPAIRQDHTSNQTDARWGHFKPPLRGHCKLPLPVARDLGVPSETLRKYVRQLEVDEGRRPDRPTSREREEIKALRKEVYELRPANEILKAASVFFATELDADRPR
jgi:transposase